VLVLGGRLCPVSIEVVGEILYLKESQDGFGPARWRRQEAPCAAAAKSSTGEK
jgi:hypothetical protein